MAGSRSGSMRWRDMENANGKTSMNSEYQKDHSETAAKAVIASDSEAIQTRPREPWALRFGRRRL
jgi:hypothetical protein